MRNENLRCVCEEAGFTDVATVIASGNVVFRSSDGDAGAMETTLERAWPEQLGFESTTIIRSRAQLEGMVELSPFGDLIHGPNSYLLVTFSKGPLHLPFDVPYQPEDLAGQVIAAAQAELFTVTDTTATKTLDVMSWVERRFGKAVTSRTWLTVHRILKKMDQL